MTKEHGKQHVPHSITFTIYQKNIIFIKNVNSEIFNQIMEENRNEKINELVKFACVIMKIFNLTINDITKINKYAEIDIELAQETLLKKLNIINININTNKIEEKTIHQIKVLQKQINELNTKLNELFNKINNIQTIQVSQEPRQSQEIQIPEFIHDNPWVSIIQNKSKQ